MIIEHDKILVYVVDSRLEVKIFFIVTVNVGPGVDRQQHANFLVQFFQFKEFLMRKFPATWIRFRSWNQIGLVGRCTWSVHLYCFYPHVGISSIFSPDDSVVVEIFDDEFACIILIPGNGAKVAIKWPSRLFFAHQVGICLGKCLYI